jgi:hypothetical protein
LNESVSSMNGSPSFLLNPPAKIQPGRLGRTPSLVALPPSVGTTQTVRPSTTRSVSGFVGSNTTQSGIRFRSPVALRTSTVEVRPCLLRS